MGFKLFPKFTLSNVQYKIDHLLYKFSEAAGADIIMLNNSGYRI